ncbi:hypothetical protein L1987_23679 [Smallanthus sonchifolius]|uniref:Uncharacterized protein n=1 Tax=Smallanthus sonchifolius TaxID=185202 RepID=A0ACB9IJU0_9ASTR|nr:hypothetical protein L1987_23679 [Smallanthus sonchifolius]
MDTTRKVRTCLKFSLLRTEVTNVPNPARATKANLKEIARNPAEKVTATARATKGNPAGATKANLILYSSFSCIQIRFHILNCFELKSDFTSCVWRISSSNQISDRRLLSLVKFSELSSDLCSINGVLLTDLSSDLCYLIGKKVQTNYSIFVSLKKLFTSSTKLRMGRKRLCITSTDFNDHVEDHETSETQGQSNFQECLSTNEQVI